LSLDTDLRPLYEPFKQATSKIIQGFESDGKAVSLDNANPIPIGDTVDVVQQFNEDGKGKAILVDSDEPVTLGQMLNQTSGFGMEFGTKVQLWKKVTEKGKGFVNSCKAVSIATEFEHERPRVLKCRCRRTLSTPLSATSLVQSMSTETLQSE
jgi:hypothetical protein